MREIKVLTDYTNEELINLILRYMEHVEITEGTHFLYGSHSNYSDITREEAILLSEAFENKFSK